MAENVGQEERFAFRKRFVEFTVQVHNLGASSTILTILTLLPILYVGMIVIGSIHFKECPVSPNVPLYLIVHGVVNIVSTIFVCSCYGPSIYLFMLAQTACVMCGSIWVFDALEPKYDPAYGDEYCNKTLYLFTLIYLSIVNIIFSIVLLITLCCLIYFLIWFAVQKLKETE